MSAYLFLHLVNDLHLSFRWFPLPFIGVSFVFFSLLNESHLVTIFWLICSDRNSALCHIRVSLTSCIGAGHIIFYAGIDSTGNQVTLWTPTFVLLSWCCCSCDLLVYLFVCFLIDLASYWFIYWLFLGYFCFFFFLLAYFLRMLHFCLFSYYFRSVLFGFVSFCFFGLLFWKIPFNGRIITFLRITFSLQAACVAVAALMQYFLMASFCWMLVEGIYIYLFVVKVYNITDKMYRYHGFCWGEEYVKKRDRS